ncbi:MAG: dihydrolipoyl dehydrogenase [Desulfobacterales bacterium]|nr:dihydrolipoyl dehydrogenase [Desulfobacterales bacterium]MDJ0855412.1 dihydrolipoyl dehydrogenase [Desulfobacterales bacterium]MDJ0888237.1 dihydrolipoyl dehydrogenase [Desulfobacterales bacterium]MDJ0989864.1 dihydrolipoyl dehydrogenase [Desulfobacterales bacterium]
MTEKTTQLAVIGAGPGGYAAAFLAADLGLQVTLIDPEANPGGVCLYRGCIPSKTLLHAAHLTEAARHAGTWGLHFEGLSVDVEALRRHKQRVVAQLTEGLGQLVKRRNIAHLRGRAVFADERHLTVEDSGGQRQNLTFEQAIIATGSRATNLALFAEGGTRIMNATAALELAEIPDRLLVVGGGYIGLELGSVYAGLGAQVSLVEMTPHLLPGVDRDLVRFLHKRLQNQFTEILLETTVEAVKSQKNGVKVGFRDKNGDLQNRLFDKALVAVGRSPQSAGLNLEKIGVATDDQGFIRVDAQRRTSRPHIFAIGDVAGQPMLAHKASHEGRVAVEVITGRKVAFEPLAVPAVVFTDPEIAWAGLTETEAKSRGVDFEVARFPWGASSRAATLGTADGLTKILVDPASETILGVGLVGPHAGELIAEGTLAVEMGANATDLGLTIHPHPTLSETLMEAAHVYHRNAAHYYTPRRKGKK